MIFHGWRTVCVFPFVLLFNHSFFFSDSHGTGHRPFLVICCGKNAFRTRVVRPSRPIREPLLQLSSLETYSVGIFSLIQPLFSWSSRLQGFIMSSMNAQAPNFEEAAEFIYSGLYNHCWLSLRLNERLGIDNLPNEVSHILQEIKHRETTTQGAPWLSIYFDLCVLIFNEELQHASLCTPTFTIISCALSEIATHSYQNAHLLCRNTQSGWGKMHVGGAAH